MANKITTLYEGSDNLYPRTKASAVSDDAGNGLDSLIIYHGNEAASSVAPINADQIQGYNLNALIDLFYPVGSIYSSTVSTSPAELFGRGTWVQITDTFLLAAGSTYSAGSTGGSAKHQHEYGMRYGGFFGDTVLEGHNYGGVVNYNTSNTKSASGQGAHLYTQSISINSGTASSGTTQNVAIYETIGKTENVSNLPPYLAVYMWKRTA